MRTGASIYVLQKFFKPPQSTLRISCQNSRLFHSYYGNFNTSSTTNNSQPKEPNGSSVNKENLPSTPSTQNDKAGKGDSENIAKLNEGTLLDGEIAKLGTDIEVRHQQPGEEDSLPATHYFDTNKVYTNLRFSGFTEGQSDIIMRAMRDILTHNLEECNEESISQSNADNEAYLFEAARSELKTEVQKLREIQSAEYSSNLARLQRDVEIAAQELNESITTMKSGIDLDINERKNTTRQDASLVDMKLQELNNRIQIDIVSDLKSEIEGLRWQTTRRGLTAVVVVLAALLIGISLGKKNEKSVKKKAPTEQRGAPIQVPILSSSEDEFDNIDDQNFAIETLNEISTNNNK